MGKSSKQTTSNVYMPGQQEAYQSLLKSAMGQVDFQKLMQPYTGQYTVPYSAAEKWGQDYMKNLLTSDPSQSEYYKGLRNQAYDNMERALTGVRQSAAMGGMLASTPRIGQEAEVQRKTANDLNTLLGSLYQQNQQNILPQYMQATGVERGIQQQDLLMRYQEFIRQMQALGIPLQTALQLATYSPVGQTTTTKPSGMSIGSDLATLGLLGHTILPFM